MTRVLVLKLEVFKKRAEMMDKSEGGNRV